MLDLTNCIVLHGADLIPHHCDRLVVQADTIARLDLGSPVQAIDHGAIVVMPGLYNCHTHMGNSCLPDGATGMTLERSWSAVANTFATPQAALVNPLHQGC